MDPTAELAAALRPIVGRRHVLTGSRATRPYRRGFRSPAGVAQAVVRPGTLVELWRTLLAIAATDAAIIMQAANTGLTGGSNPEGDIGRSVVVVSTSRISGVQPILGGRQVLCLPGATLHRLERALRPLGREPHSVIGSSCIGASVIGGVCNNSGGSLVRRGPAFTELSLFARIGADGTLELVNRLGIDLGDDPETILTRLETGDFIATESGGVASDRDYAEHVRAVDAPTPARFNADPRRLFDASGSAGRIAVFAVRLDTFARAQKDATFYIGSNDAEELAELRRALLTAPSGLPISAEYLHRDAFDVADRYGRDTFLAIRLLGTDRIPLLYTVRAWIDALGDALGIAALSDRALHGASRFLPDHLPRRLREWRARFEHHVILSAAAEDVTDIRETLERFFPSKTGAAFLCTKNEATKASLHRFVTAGAATRYQAVAPSRIGSVVALDVALPRNARNWFGPLPSSLQDSVVATLRYGHFLCHVFHRDYLVAPAADPVAVKAALMAELDAEGAEYPAEHNVGRQYRAKAALSEFYRKLDPTNRFNPGIGVTARGPDWAAQDVMEERQW